MWVYKITNKLDQKCYIGITVDLEERWKQHRLYGTSDSKYYKKYQKTYPLYIAIQKDGLSNFTFEIIKDNVLTLKELGELERKYIKEFHSHISEHGYNQTWGGEAPQWDANPRATLTVDDVVDIRIIYNKCEIGVSECWEMYKDRISYSAFEKVWEGQTWKGIMMEVYTEENKNKHKNEISRQKGKDNGNAIYTDEEVLELRRYYVTHTLEETYQKYGQKSKSKQGFRSTVDRSYTYLPIYSKVKKKWFLNNQEIDIEKYNPVSTISESGE